MDYYFIAAARLLFYLSTAISLLLATTQAKKKLKEQDIIQRVLKDYDWRVRPRGGNDSIPGIVFYGLALLSFTH